MTDKEQEDIQAMMNIFFPFAEELLIKFGEFPPYAGAITHNGEFVSASQPDQKDQHIPEAAISRIKVDLKESAALYKVIGIFYEARTRDAETGKTSDSIAVFVEHSLSDAAYEFFYPYLLKEDGSFVVEDMYGNPVTKEIFPTDTTPASG